MGRFNQMNPENFKQMKPNEFSMKPSKCYMTSPIQSNFVTHHKRFHANIKINQSEVYDRLQLAALFKTIRLIN